MDDQKPQIVEKLKQATNILVTVSANPTVDQLSAAIGLTLFLNHLGKHASAVFSGQVPSTMEFLQPEKTIEKTTDSLRDFIISLDKSKADKLRYKVEDQMVKIFITPYQTSISEKDLGFSHGDFNVEVVIALGVKEQGQLDQAITSHGRILHDATVIGVGTQEAVALGTVNWNDAKASSLCEMVTSLSMAIKPEALDAQMSTALLTGIVAETERFSNEKTSSETMQLSAKLMAAGANQQLVATQLEQPEKPAPDKDKSGDKGPDEDGGVTAELPEPKDDGPDGPSEPAKTEDKDDGSLRITHGNILPFDNDTSYKPGDPEEPELDQIHIDEDGTIKSHDELEVTREKVIEPPSGQDSSQSSSSRLILEPPTMGGKLTANSEPEGLDPSTDPLGSQAPQTPLLNRNDTSGPAPAPSETPAPATEHKVIEPSPPATPATNDTSLTDLEKAVQSPHADAPSHLDAARDAVSQAAASATPAVLEPVQALNAQPVDLNQDPQIGTPPAIQDASQEPTVINPSTQPTSLVPPDPGLPADNTAASVTDPTAPPPVPPPMMPPDIPPANPPADRTPGSTAL